MLRKKNKNSMNHIYGSARENISLSYVMKTMEQWDKIRMYLL